MPRSLQTNKDFIDDTVEIDRRVAARALADAAEEILSNALDEAVITGKTVEQNILFAGGSPFNPKHYDEVRIEFRPMLGALRSKCWTYYTEFSPSHKDGDVTSSRPLTFTATFKPSKRIDCDLL